MGSAASRRLPKEKPSWTGSRPRSEPGPTGEAAPPRPGRPLASETKSEEIEADAKDPQLMSNLSRLGPVRVDHRMQAVRAANQNHIQNMYRIRAQSEAQALSSQSTKNRLLASSLSELLEARKSVTSLAELEELAKRYRIDVEKLQQLCLCITSPSIDESTVVRTRDEHGEESVTMMARWVDPVLRPAQATR
ncbi:hypothetical protein F5I97DRAFT_1934601 [Phlebopus sp. FC_14]|nr:hypothetical protein F5I97DRAFT_1934601 [Phlebopus sp. FC_14]